MGTRVSKRYSFSGCEKELFRNYVNNCKRKKISFNLKLSQIINISSMNCYYCGEPPRNIKWRRYFCFIYQGIDRMNNKKGYSIDNVVPCCLSCNSIKGDRLSHQEMILVAQVLLGYRKAKLALLPRILKLQALAESNHCTQKAKHRRSSSG